MENPSTVDAMSLDNNRVGAIEQELLQQRDTLNTIQSQLSQLLVNAQVAPSTGGTLPNNSDTPSNGPTTTSTNSRMKPAAPSEFDGSRSKGRAFLNSCELYIGLAPNQFPSDDSKIYWALSYMKGDRAARFTDRTMRYARDHGSLPYASWTSFRKEFVQLFCPKNEMQTARMRLETSKYHQGSRAVDDYVDEFRELIDMAKYEEGANIVLKFRHGLNSEIQRYIACLTAGRPSDDDPEEWFEAAVLCDDNRIANDAFQATFRSTRSHTFAPASNRTVPASNVGSNNSKLANPVRGVLPMPTASSFPFKAVAPSFKDPNAMEIDANRKKGPQPSLCFRCGEPGHMVRDCPHRFDVRYMTIDERSDFAQQVFVGLDTKVDESEASEEEEKVVETSEVQQDFASRSG
jgi:hypothetical protein